MKKTGSLAMVIFALYWAGSLTSCQQENDPEHFLIKIDSVYIPETIIPNEAFEIEFFGYIGHNGCYSFNEFVLNNQNKNITVEVWGKLDVKSGICSDEMVYLRGEKLNCTLEEAGNYILKIKQPNGTYFERAILVK